jgi:transcription antitermination factor NusB
LKTSKDPRHIRRIEAVQSLFAYSFHPEQPEIHELAKEVLEHTPQIDAIIEKCAPEWPLTQINRLDLNVLRLAVYEMLYKPETPPKVIIDEAVEIGKSFGSQSSGSFINGVLASALRETDRAKDIVPKEEEQKDLPQNTDQPVNDESTPTPNA